MNDIRKKILTTLLIIIFYTVAQAQNQSKTENDRVLSLPLYTLQTTTTVPSDSAPEKGTIVFNTNSDIKGTLLYPSIGSGVYVFDGTGWLVAKGEVMRHSKTGFGIVNAVIFLDKGIFNPPQANIEAGRYFYIRNTSINTSVGVANTIDFGRAEPETVRLSPKDGAIMIYSNGSSWFRIQ